MSNIIKVILNIPISTSRKDQYFPELKDSVYNQERRVLEAEERLAERLSKGNYQ